jgi:hypothetical protein
MSGVATAHFSLYSQGQACGSVTMNLISGDTNDGVWQGSVVLEDDTSCSNDYITFAQFSVTDAVGNSQFVKSTGSLSGGMFVVTNLW